MSCNSSAAELAVRATLLWVRIELRAFAFTRHPASPRPHAVNEENAALRKAIARRRRRADRGAREGADGPELGLRGALVLVRVPIVWLDTRPLSVAQGGAACVIPQQVRVQLLQRANVDFKPLIDHFSALEYATKYATKQESRLELTTRTGVEGTDGSAETVRFACPRASLQARG